MIDFIISVIASVIGTLVIILITSILSRRAKWLLMGIFSRIWDIDVDYVYKNKAQGTPDLINEMRRSSQVYIMTGRGNELGSSQLSMLPTSS